MSHRGKGKGLPSWAQGSKDNGCSRGKWPGTPRLTSCNPLAVLFKDGMARKWPCQTDETQGHVCESLRGWDEITRHLSALRTRQEGMKFHASCIKTTVIEYLNFNFHYPAPCCSFLYNIKNSWLFAHLPGGANAPHCAFTKSRWR